MESPYQVSKNDIQIFRDWLEKQPFLPHDVEDHYIRSFIIGAKGSIQRAKLTFDNFYNSAHMYPELFEDYDPFSAKAEKFNKLVAYCTIPTHKYNLLVSKILITDSTDFGIAEYFVKHFHNLQISLWNHPRISRNIIKEELAKSGHSRDLSLERILAIHFYTIGYGNTTGNCQAVYLIDVTGIHLGHFKTATPMLAEKLMGCVSNANPIRIEGIHLLNMPPLLEWAINMFIQLMPEKLRNRVHLHSNLKSLHKKIATKYLPEEYGGEQKSITDLYGEQMDTLRFYREKLMSQKSIRDEERKYRLKDVKTEVGGTFRQLSID